MKTFTRMLLSACLALGVTASVFAADKVVLKDGREFSGEIVKKTDTYVQIRVILGSLEQVQTFWMGDVAKIVEDVADSNKETGSDESTQPKPAGAAPKPATSGSTEKGLNRAKPGVIVLPMKGTVGIEFRKEEIERVAEEADKIKRETGISPIIVLEIESGGGLMLEMYNIHESLTELKKNHRIVAWIKQAISAAAATAFHCDEIYFMTEGNLGAMTGFNAGTGQSLKGPALEQWLSDASEWAESGGRPGMIARAMIHHPVLLSYDKDPETGKVTWYESLQGEYKLSDEISNLSFSSSQALHSGFADGVADTKEQLAKFLDLAEWNEMSRTGYEAYEDWNKTVSRAKVEIPRIFGRFQIIQGSAAASPEEKIGRMIDLLEQLIMWSRRAPNVARYEAGLPPIEELERMIRDLKKQLSDMRRGR